MAYATATQVQGQDSGRRTFSASSTPNLTQVQGYIDQTAAEIDALLRGRGYTLPVATTATSALALLAHGNVLGAAAMLSQGAPTPGGRRSEAATLWENFKKALATGVYELEAAKDTTQAVVRASAAPSAMFTRSVEH